ncbi:MAG: CDP-glycerol glycerophosphotransferase family protein [Bacilli bacterium]|nr:CDP-glycerol glycerophosphotransferase family protein [Bacilli bacterium]
MKKTIKKIVLGNSITRELAKKYIYYRRKRIYNNFCKQNAIDSKMIIFESFIGRSYCDSGKAIYEEMIKDERFNDFTFVWAFKNVEEKKDIPELSRAILVKHRSAKYFEYYSKAKYIVSNSRIDMTIKRRDGQVYIQTWHGTPLKRLGYDIEVKGANALYSNKELCKLYDIDSVRYSYLLSPSAFCTEKFASAFNLKENAPKCEIIEEGYPRNDFLTRYTKEDIKKIKEKLGIDHNKKVILYAPTWRDNQYKGDGYSYKLAVDFDKLRSQLGEEYIILFRAHYFVANSFDFKKYDGFIYDVSHYEDINHLYVVSDMLITDYSSVFFDYSILKRPIIFYMYDLDAYQGEIRGFYISLDDLPGNIVKTEEELINEINKEFIYDEKYKKFNERFTYLDDGYAAKRVIDRCIKGEL